MSKSAPSSELPDPWPRLEWEPQVWLPTSGWSVNAEFGSGGQPYRSAVPPLIAGLTPRPDSEAREAAEAAVQELSRFDAELGSRVTAFAPVLLRSESASSSQIENLTASARAIFTAELGVKTSRHAELIAANTRSLQAAIALSDSLSAGAIAEMHRVLMGDQMRHTPGEWRREAVWIGTRSNSPLGADFVAPQFERIPGLIDDVVEFSQRNDIPALVSTAVAHAQFETIHPFTDGNGRTGRALAQALLRHRGVTRNIAIPVSAGLLADVEGYHRALTAYRNGDVTPIVLAFAEASLRAVANSRRLVADIDAITEGWRERLTVRRSSNAWMLIDVIARQPVIDSATAATALGVKQPNIYPALQALTDAGILKSKSEHRAGPFWRSDEVLKAIDDFAERAGRRGRS
ncbi:Fic family protein [Herbiconiux sp. KACC 21604]|uniref:Fic family protein n=1 Tax=unclassified Herbiconiux TaxID=2618217 RepID=UPI0014928754|nr:Fic family protein [Herbiconiux sp. SALV-R1]QJU52660.1 Fic family protein [Herbiconiux sp. SALV-R1]WPO87555.1 Fic family protein [Herbiconiux sp. KACC 21604]